MLKLAWIFVFLPVVILSGIRFLIPILNRFYQRFSQSLPDLWRNEGVGGLFNLWMTYLINVGFVGLFVPVSIRSSLILEHIISIPKPYPFYFPAYEPLSAIARTEEFTMIGVIVFICVARMVALKGSHCLLDVLFSSALAAFTTFIWLWFTNPEFYDFLSPLSDISMNSIPHIAVSLFAAVTILATFTEFLCWLSGFARRKRTNATIQ